MPNGISGTGKLSSVVTTPVIERTNLCRRENRLQLASPRIYPEHYTNPAHMLHQSNELLDCLVSFLEQTVTLKMEKPTKYLYYSQRALRKQVNENKDRSSLWTQCLF